MNSRRFFSAEDRAIGKEAAAWVVREERGLTAAEQDALSHWLSADPRHRMQFAERRWAWREFDRVAGLPAALVSSPNPDLLARPESPRRARRTHLMGVALGLAAATALTIGFWPEETRSPAPKTIRSATFAAPAPREIRTLDDGSVVQLNRGAHITVDFSPGLRRVRLERGEAYFSVAKDPGRPFVVDAAGIAVRAVGTIFNVRLATSEVEVVVAEGKVLVERGGHERATPPLTASQRVVVPLVAGSPASAVSTLGDVDLAARLAWLPRLLDFTDLPLGAAVDQMNRHNPVHVTLATPELSERRINASIRSDNVEGFIRLMEAALGVRAEWRSEHEVALHPAH